MKKLLSACSSNRRPQFAGRCWTFPPVGKNEAISIGLVELQQLLLWQIQIPRDGLLFGFVS
jgi:hypothetical protein